MLTHYMYTTIYNPISELQAKHWQQEKFSEIPSRDNSKRKRKQSNRSYVNIWTTTQEHQSMALTTYTPLIDGKIETTSKSTLPAPDS